MSQEIEIKLTLPVRMAPALRRHPLIQDQPAHRKFVRNIYYDTPDQALRQRRIALRHRQIGKQWLITVKTSAPSQDGCSRRNEWECPCAPGTFDFSHVDDVELAALLEQLRPQLQVAFRTDFYRSTWILESGKDRAELALDLGHIISGGLRQHIHEVEIELLAGDEDYLHRIAEILRRDLPLQPFAPSKASRGYSLMRVCP
jgi:triphosphatase